jgi:hypothetical protein
MFKIQFSHTSVLTNVVFVVVSIVSSMVYADEQSFIYVSDLIQEHSNSEQEIWQYQNKVPLAYQKHNSSQSQYTYVRPTQKIGSNPISNPQYKRQFSLNNNTKNYVNVSGKTYYFPPAVQKTGSNPFIKLSNQYVNSDNIDQFFASSCGCEKSSYHGVMVNY